jgi:hypothetical protein
VTTQLSGDVRQAGRKYFRRQTKTAERKINFSRKQKTVKNIANFAGKKKSLKTTVLFFMAENRRK